MTLLTKDYLLATLSEECGEVQQAIGKSLRFGLLDQWRKQGNKTNWVCLRQEIHDMIAVYEMLCDEFDREETLDRELIKRKKQKVFKYMQVSQELGRLK